MACHGGQVGWFSQCQIQAKVAVTARPWWPGCVVASPPLSLGIRIAGPTSCYRTFQLPLDLQVSTGKLVLLSRCKTAFAQVVVVVSRWWVWCPGGGCSVQVVGVVAVVAVMAVVVVVAVLWLPLDLQVSTGKLVLLS